jgi:hypothetical protein
MRGIVQCFCGAFDLFNASGQGVQGVLGEIAESRRWHHFLNES